MTKIICTFLVLSVTIFSMRGQDFINQIEGQVYSKDGDVTSVHVSNISLNRGTITDNSGYFKISGRLNDTLVFSAVQYHRVKIIVTTEVLQQKNLRVLLKESLTELDEVIVTPYNLTGNLKKDMGNLKTEPVVTASTLNLPNAYVKVKTQNERRLFEADNGKFIYLGNYKLDSSFNPTVMINFYKILNRATGRTKKLKKYVRIDKEINLLQRMKHSFADSVYVKELNISKEHLNEFFYFCEADSLFTTVSGADDKLKIWEFLKVKSTQFNNYKK